MTDTPKKLPLQVQVGDPDAHEIVVRFNGAVVQDFVEVDVLGCWGRRIAVKDDGSPMLDDDGCICYEKVYGNFELSWTKDEEKPDPNWFYGMPFAGLADGRTLREVTNPSGIRERKVNGRFYYDYTNKHGLTFDLSPYGNRVESWMEDRKPYNAADHSPSCAMHRSEVCDCLDTRSDPEPSKFKIVPAVTLVFRYDVDQDMYERVAKDIRRKMDAKMEDLQRNAMIGNVRR